MACIVSVPGVCTCVHVYMDTFRASLINRRSASALSFLNREGASQAPVFSLHTSCLLSGLLSVDHALPTTLHETTTQYTWNQAVHCVRLSVSPESLIAYPLSRWDEYHNAQHVPTVDANLARGMRGTTVSLMHPFNLKRPPRAQH